ncbi:iron-sulfur cluster biosynthesis family protein [Enterococcus nangangensis]|uniref:iron-sulfur cluster biosynthesis family protein n=1 Tax=Enterococcus nangangensis TaxID=2559926 RepID=UPI0014851185|nr:iron-sulfur cluster biosynthesis family protein [Enterococcus nangangensis]
MMKVTMTTSAAQVLRDKLPHQKVFLLTTNDGANEFSSAGGACMIGDRFQLVPVEQAVEPFTERVQTDPYEIYISNYEKMFLGDAPRVTFNEHLHLLQLTNETGILDANLHLAEPVASYSGAAHDC